jgi:erythromycin esterase
MKVRLFFFLFLSPLIFSNFSDEDQFIIDWINGHCHPINVDKAEFDEDLGFLDEIQKGKRIISVGEEAHGISDFAKMRFEIFKYLVLHHGYTIYAVEDDFVRLTELNKYLQSGEGNPAEIMKNLYRSQANATTLGMIEWMRRYNAELKDLSQNLKIYGYDCQLSEGALGKLKEVFSSEKEIVTFLDTVKLVSPRNYYAPVLTGQNINILGNFIDESMNESTDTSLVNQLYRVIKYSHLINTGKGNRDEFMAKNIQWILNSEGRESKMVVSAHNFHVGYNQFERRGQAGKLGTIGWHLKNHYPDKLFTIWLDFNKGSFLAAEFENGNISVKSFNLPDAPEGSLSSLFSKVGYKAFFLDNSDILESQNIKEWFSEFHTMRYITADFSEQRMKENDGMKKEKLLESCDGLIFVNEVSEYKLLKDIDK